MLTPTILMPLRPFYSVGNTPAVSLTRDLPQGQDAAILSLGCGDVRNILYTAYVERGLPSRKLDITCCDLETNIIARNILFWTFVLDGSSVSSDALWKIYYNLYLDDANSQLVQNQLKRLLPLTESLDGWHGAATYGSSLRFCDADTLALVRSIWVQYASALTARSTAAYRDAFRDAMQRSNDFKDRVVGPGQILTGTVAGVRAGAPLGAVFMKKGAIDRASDRFWRTGPTGDASAKGKGGMAPNPLIAAALAAESRVLSFPADPLLSFHLAAAEADLTALSPLRLDSKATGEARLLAAAQFQFREWVAAFRDMAGRVVLRFVAADAFAFCHTLQNNLDSGALSANLYRDEIGCKPLILAESEYGKEGLVPRQFDVIDTSNISDYNGAVNVLVTTVPLLKDAVTSTLYTEVLERGKVKDSSNFSALLCGHTQTLSILLGLAPVEYWTNATVTAIVDEVLIAMADPHAKETGPKIQARLTWKLASHFSSSSAGSQLSVAAEDLARTALQVYLHMFRFEDPTIFQVSRDRGREEVLRSMAEYAVPKYHRLGHVALFKAICKQIKTDQSEFGAKLVSLLQNDRTLMLGTNHLQEVCLQLSRAGIHSERWLTHDIQRNPSKGGFWAWKVIPEGVAVTVAIPPSKWRPIYEEAVKKGLSFNVEAHVIGENGASYDIYTDLQVSFGKVITRGSPTEDNFSVSIEEGADSTMIATFYVAAAGLQAAGRKANISICIQSTLQNRSSLGHLNLGMPMAIDRVPLDESRAYVSRYMAGQSGTPVIGGSFPSGVQHLAVKDSAFFVASIDANSGDITSLTGHLDVTSDLGKQVLIDKASVDLHQPSPFVIDIVLGKKTLVLPITFPVPVLKSDCRTRIARKSAYIEIIAPPAAPLAPILDDFIFPSVLNQSSPTSPAVPATLNIPHVNLNALPILSIEKSSNLRTFYPPLISLLFSNRERAQRSHLIDSTASGLSASSARQNFKESLFTMFMLAAGVQGGQTGLFALQLDHPSRGGNHALVFVSAVRLDVPAAGVVLDAAVLPLTRAVLDDPQADAFLLALRAFECCSLTVDEAELRLWKRALPALAERCRTWVHTPDCAYARPGAKVPLSEELEETPLCACGRGKLPNEYMSLPEWDAAARWSTRVAISPAYASALVEDVVDPDMMAGGAAGAGPAGGGEVKERCRNCGRTEAREGGGVLKRCARCKEVKYCSAECQKKDWKKHRGECAE